MNNYSDRRSALAALITLVPGIEDVLVALPSLVTPLAEPPIRLDRADVRRALDAYDDGELTDDLVERWAEAIHTADDVELDPADRDYLSDALFALSTPELFGSMDEVVLELRARDPLGDARGSE